MKRNIILPIISLIGIPFLLFLANCGNDDEEEPNKPPVLNITSPAANANLEIGSAVQISVTANDPDGSVASVNISIDNSNKATLQNAPYTYSWDTEGETSGQHTIRAVATDNGGLTASAQVTVNLEAGIPTVTTAEITEITENSATGGGNVVSNGGETLSARGVVWSTTSGPTIADNDGSTNDGTGTGSFTSSLTNLTANTTYYVKAYATNSQATAYGEEKSFTTTGALPTVITGEVTNITAETAECPGEVTDDGGQPVTARGLVWSVINTEPSLEDNDGFTVEGGGTGVFAGTMSSLTRYTMYYVRAYATTNNGTAYGEIKFFRTFPDVPVLITADISEVGAHVARSGGIVTDDGGPGIGFAGVGGFGIIWSTSPDVNLNNYEGQFGYLEGAPEDSYTSVLSALAPETTYYVRAYGYYDFNDPGYGETKSFTTKPFTVTQGSFTDARDNTEYNTIKLRDQVWMAKNLAYLPQVCPSSGNCGYWVYDYQGSNVAAAKATANFDVYGVLYDGEIALDVCPAGWHLPSQEEWTVFEMDLGMDYNSAVNAFSIRGTDEGGKLKETGLAHWQSPNEGATNLSGFTALPGGKREVSDKTFQNLGTSCYFWSANPDPCIWREIDTWNTGIHSNNDFRQNAEGYGFSIRCVKD